MKTEIQEKKTVLKLGSNMITIPLKEETEEKVLYWSKEDTPIPRKNEILTNVFNEKYRVISAEKRSEDIEITLRRIN